MSKILKGLNEVNPHNYDSDWDYQDAVAKSGRSRSSYRSQEDDTSDADIAYSKKMYQLSQKQKRDADHDRLASGTNEAQLDELSTNKLSQYKTAAATDAGKADSEGDYKRADKRFSGIVKATKKQFANDEKSVAENKLGEMIPWPVVANKIGSAMKAMGWKAQRKGDDAFMFSTKGAEDESQYYMVMIDNEGDGMFSYALGTFEGGRPDIGEHGKLPTTEASVSEVLMAIRDGYGLNEIVAENAWDRLQREKALESAGVGIITKQNTTVDVNKNTPKKNLKAFRLI